MKSILIILSIFLIQILNAQNVHYPLDPKEIEVAADLFDNIFFISISDPNNFEFCDNIHIGCGSRNEDGYYNIEEIKFLYNSGLSGSVEVSQNFTSLSLLSKISSYSNQYTFGTTFYNLLPTLLNLTELKVYEQTTTIPAVSLPPKIITIIFDKLSTILPEFFFRSKSLNTLQIISFDEGFSVQDLSRNNDALKKLTIPVTFGFPNVGYFLKGLKELTLNVYNDKRLVYFPDIEPFTSIESLSVVFQVTYGNYLKYEYPHYFNKMSKLINLTVKGPAFIVDPTLGNFNISTIKHGVNLYFEQASVPLLILPNGSRLSTLESNYKFSDIDFTKLVSFRCIENNVGQELPIISNPTSFEKFVINWSNVTGDIPDNYCFINELNIGENKLNGYLPTCITCIDGSTNPALPNEFPNFNETTPTSCPSFKVDIYNETQYHLFIIDTNGGTVSISGVNLGWTIQSITPHLPEITYKNVLANTQFDFYFPPGIGYDTVANIYFQSGLEYTLHYNYTAPFVNYYTILQGVNNKHYLVLNGVGFDYQDKNNVSIDGNLVNFEAAVNKSTTFLEFSAEDMDWSIGSEHEITMNIGGQQSNIFKLFYFNIKVFDNIKLNDQGGSISLNGSFVDSTFISNVSVIINNSTCTVNSVSLTSLSITYPSSSVLGYHELLLNIGGNSLFIPVEYINTPIPTEPSIDSSSSSDVSICSIVLPSSSFYLIFFIVVLIILQI